MLHGVGDAWGLVVRRKVIDEILHREQSLSAGRTSRRHGSGSTFRHRWRMIDKSIEGVTANFGL